MEKRALLAIALSFAVFFGYSKLLQIFYPNYGNAPQKQETTISPGPARPAETPLAQGESLSPPSDQELQAIDRMSNHGGFRERRVRQLVPEKQGRRRRTAGSTGTGRF